MAALSVPRILANLKQFPLHCGGIVGFIQNITKYVLGIRDHTDAEEASTH